MWATMRLLDTTVEHYCRTEHLSIYGPSVLSVEDRDPVTESRGSAAGGNPAPPGPRALEPPAPSRASVRGVGRVAAAGRAGMVEHPQD
jgi:hypothetical protein